MERRQFLVECNHCGNKGLANVKGSFDNVEEDIIPETGQKVFISSKKWILLECQVCHEAILIYKDIYDLSDEESDDFEMVYPLKTIEMKNTPNPIKSKFEAAIKNYNIDNEICILALRMVLELICKDQGMTSGKLYEKINNLAASGVFPSELKDCSDLIRLIGNDGAHADLNKVTKWEIKDSISLVEFMILYLYEIPNKINKLKLKYSKKTS